MVVKMKMKKKKTLLFLLNSKWGMCLEAWKDGTVKDSSKFLRL